jgi:hypothetical protein
MLHALKYRGMHHQELCAIAELKHLPVSPRLTDATPRHKQSGELLYLVKRHSKPARKFAIPVGPRQLVGSFTNLPGLQIILVPTQSPHTCSVAGVVKRTLLPFLLLFLRQTKRNNALHRMADGHIIDMDESTPRSDDSLKKSTSSSGRNEKSPPKQKSSPKSISGRKS